MPAVGQFQSFKPALCSVQADVALLFSLGVKHGFVMRHLERPEVKQLVSGGSTTTKYSSAVTFDVIGHWIALNSYRKSKCPNEVPAENRKLSGTLLNNLSFLQQSIIKRRSLSCRELNSDQEKGSQ